MFFAAQHIDLCQRGNKDSTHVARDTTPVRARFRFPVASTRSEEHTSELQSQSNLVCRLLLEKKNKHNAPDRPRILLQRRYRRPKYSSLRANDSAYHRQVPVGRIVGYLMSARTADVAQVDVQP